MASVDKGGDGRRRRVTYSQLEMLWKILNSHRDVAVGFNKTVHAREHAKRTWQLVADSLNSHGNGAAKDWKGWSIYWVDYKAKLKRKCAVARVSLSRIKGGPSDVSPLSEVEKKFEALLGAGFGSGFPSIQLDPFPSVPIPDIELSGETVGETEASAEPLVPGSPRNPSAARSNYPGRRRRRQRNEGLSLEAARSALVDVSRARLQIEERKARVAEARLALDERRTSALETIVLKLSQIADQIMERSVINSTK